jgi:hypothetical protein
MEFKFVSIKTEEGQKIAGDYLAVLPQNAVIPVFKDDFETINEVEKLNLSYEALPNEEPNGDNVVFFHGYRSFKMMTKAQLYKEYFGE